MPATVEAIEDLYRSRYASYRGGVAALAGDDAARDVVQEAFAQALRHREDYRGEGEGSLAAWVWRIAFRAALRSRSNGDRELTLDELVETAPVPRAERDPELAEAVRCLAPRRRLVVYLRYFADLPYAEIASLLDISEGTVAATLSQAHAELLEQLRDKEAVQ
jgi:RNA polymerase sigma-70 factor (ECF subfamily)